MERQQNQKEKSLAWFKLADLIARGEREKALSVFRLLAHSLPDRAYVLQLEGDILWYLDDKNAAEKYRQAAFLYQKEKRWVDVISIYEHLMVQNPESIDVLTMLLKGYAILDWPEKFRARFSCFVAILSEKKCTDFQAEKLIRDLVDTVKSMNESKESIWVTGFLQEEVIKLSGDLASRLQGIL